MRQAVLCTVCRVKLQQVGAVEEVHRLGQLAQRVLATAVKSVA